jgi:NADH dehydrogenase
VQQQSAGSPSTTSTPARVLVTGANGHIGLRLLRRLASRAGDGIHACAVVRSQSAAAAVRAAVPAASVEVRIVDYQDVDALARAAEACSHVVHLVGILKQTALTRYADAHESAATSLARAAEKAGVRRIVYLSILGADPDSPNPCLASKGRAERILLERAVPTTVIRLPMVLAPGDPAALALASRARASFVPLVRGGASFEQPIDGDDVTTAILLALSRRDLAGVLLELAGPEALPHRELVRRAASLHGRRPRIFPLPYSLVAVAAALFERVLANPPLTRAMLDVLEHDDRIEPGPACRRLGLVLTPLDDTLRRCAGPEAS